MLRIAALRQHDQKFLTAPADTVAVILGTFPQSLGDCLENEITAVVPVGVVELFEKVDIAHREGEALASSAGVGDKLVKLLLAEAAVGKPGQNVLLDEQTKGCLHIDKRMGHGTKFILARQQIRWDGIGQKPLGNLLEGLLRLLNYRHKIMGLPVRPEEGKHDRSKS